jgi:hypothetical protein
MRLPEILYGRRVTPYSTETRYGSSKLGIVGMVVRFKEMAPAHLWQIGRLGIAYGPGGGVEAGLYELTPEQRGPSRIFYRKSGMALGVNWAGRGKAA